MASAADITSVSVVAKLLTDRRMTHRPCHCAPPTKQCPCSRARSMGARVCRSPSSCGASEPKQHGLIEHDFIDQLDARFAGDALGHSQRVTTALLDHCGNAAAAQVGNHGPGRKPKLSKAPVLICPA